MTRADAPGVVRDDPGGTIRWALRLHIQCGRDLRSDGEMLRDSTGLAGWQARLDDWTVQAVQTLHDQFEQETVQEYLRATARPADANNDGWRRTLNAELRQVENALELLTALESTLDGRGGMTKKQMRMADG